MTIEEINAQIQELKKELAKIKNEQKKRAYPPTAYKALDKSADETSRKIHDAGFKQIGMGIRRLMFTYYGDKISRNYETSCWLNTSQMSDAEYKRYIEAFEKVAEILYPYIDRMKISNEEVKERIRKTLTPLDYEWPVDNE